MTRRRDGARTQAQRSAQTRAALLDATLECLVELGYARTTTTEIVHRAGLSLGAMVHHFPSKNELMTAAVGHLLQRRQAEFRAEMAAAGQTSDRMATAIDLLWKAFSGPTFVAWVELWVGSRSDPELASAVTVMEEQFLNSSQELFRELFPPDGPTGARVDERAMGFAFAVMEGVALKGLHHTHADTDPLRILKTLARQLSYQEAPTG